MGEGGGGGLIRDHDGKVVLAFNEFCGTFNSFDDEVRAICRRLQICGQRNFRDIWVKLHSPTVVILVKKKTNAPWEFHIYWRKLE